MRIVHFEFKDGEWRAVVERSDGGIAAREAYVSPDGARWCREKDGRRADAWTESNLSTYARVQRECQ